MGDTETIGRYRLRELLGRGGMGDVYLATAEGAAGFEKVVAVKVLSDRHTSDEALVRLLLREAMLGVRLDNERLVQVLDFGEHEGQYFIAMEYVRGFDLATVLDYLATRRQRVPVQVAAHIARTLADALIYVHGFADAKDTELGLIHGDVTPSNVLLAADGRIKLSDYGVAVLAGEDSARLVAGKPPFLPPEARRGAPRAQGWDVYALGRVLDAMLSGDAEAADAVPPELRAVAAKATAEAPLQRYRTATAFRAAVDAAVPRAIDDVDRHRAFVQLVFDDRRFVERHGELPAAGGLPSGLSLASTIASREISTKPSPPRPPQKLRFGLSAALGPDRARTAGEQIAAFLNAHLDRTVHTVAFADYRELVDAAATGKIDLAWMPPVAYAHAAERAVGAVVTAERAGRPSFESAIFVRDDSALQTLEDLRGKRAAWVDRNSASGYLFAAAELVRHLGRLDEALAGEHFFGSHRDVCEAVLNGWADFGASFVTLTPSGRIATASWRELVSDRADELRALAFTPPIPCDNIAHRPGLPAPIRDEVRALFLSMHASPEGQQLLTDVFQADAFAIGDDDAYGVVRARMLLL